MTTIRALLTSLLLLVGLSACGNISYDPSRVPNSTWNTGAGTNLLTKWGVRVPGTTVHVLNNLGDRDIILVNQYANPDQEVLIPPGQDLEIAFRGFGYQYREEFALTVRVRDDCGRYRTSTRIFRAQSRRDEQEVWNISRLPRGSCRVERRRT